MFKKRSYFSELLDGTDLPELDLFQNLKELHFINTYLGGYRITFDALQILLSNRQENYYIVDIGSGGGDTLKEIYHWCHSKNIKATLTGIDLKPSCINYSNLNNPIPSIEFICDDYVNALNHLEKIDFIHASLFCHHLTEKQIVALIHFSQSANATLIINDLERNPIAYYAIKLLTKLFSNSYLVKNDAPLSVLRGFKKKEWLEIIQQSGAKNYTLKNKWAFRHQVIIYAK
jgi:2-polyprenyl-3-methyl-5-hydroxy-6-metoxy-1,4-benzoquinol methylase